MAVHLLALAAAISFSALTCVEQAASFVHPGGLARHQGRTPRLTCLPQPSSCSSNIKHDAGRQGRPSSRRKGRRGSAAQTHSHAHKAPLAEDAPNTAMGGRGVVDGEGGSESLLDELLARCAEATKSGAATESSHTGSSEWAGFKTNPELLEGVKRVLTRARQRSRQSDGSAMAWSWLTLSPRPVRVAVATPADGRVAVYLTVLPAGNGSPPSHRPMYGCHILSRVLTGEVEQVKSNSQRVIGRSTHSLETPVWSSFGGGARRLINESFQPAVILEVVLYDWSRGPGYSGSYAAPGTSNSGSAERRAEAEGVGRAEAAGAEGDGGGPAGADGGHGRALLPIVEMDACPCPPELLFRDGDVYEEEEEEDEGGGGLTLVRSDGRVVERGREGGGGIGRVEDLLTAGELACDVGGLDGQLEDIARRVLSTRSIPTELRQALGVSHVRGLLLHGPPGCGKTLLARELSRRLGARPPKLVSGPEILDKWVGEAERKVRLLFLDAELDHEKCVQMGEDPAGLPLNLICFDEIDALCRSRGSLSGDTSGVRDSVVNQILSKMDGLVNLENVLVVGMTNRKELLDEALLRPGRMEVCMPIPLPDARGREQILAIHLRRAREAGLVSEEVDDASIAARTDGFSGADLAGLVRSATSFALADWRRKRGGAGDGHGYADGGESSGDGQAPASGGGFAGDKAEKGMGGSGRKGGDDAGEGSGGGGGSGGGDDGPAVEITSENLEQALREVSASGSGCRRRGRFGLGGVGGAVRGGLSRVLSTARCGGG